MACVSVTEPQISAVLLFPSSALEDELNGVYSHLPIRFLSHQSLSPFLALFFKKILIIRVTQIPGGDGNSLVITSRFSLQGAW